MYWRPLIGPMLPCLLIPSMPIDPGCRRRNLRQVDREKIGLIHLCDGPGPIPSLDDPNMIGVARKGGFTPGEGEIDLKVG